MRYFRADSSAVYESVRAEFDAIWGYPNEQTKTETAIPPASVAPMDPAGRVYLMASQAECEYPAIAERLPALLSSGHIEEIDAEEYSSQFPPPF
jgi:hypothetical protein